MRELPTNFSYTLQLDYQIYIRLHAGITDEWSGDMSYIEVIVSLKLECRKQSALVT